MFSRASTLILLSLALSSFVAATPCSPGSPGSPPAPPTPPYGGPAVPPGGPPGNGGGSGGGNGGNGGGGNGGGGNGGGQCNTGNLQCCNSVQKADDPSSVPLLGMLGINLSSITGLIGINCTPINILGIGGNHCTQQPVCCTGNNFKGGLVNVGCTPINVGI